MLTSSPGATRGPLPADAAYDSNRLYLRASKGQACLPMGHTGHACRRTARHATRMFAVAIILAAAQPAVGAPRPVAVRHWGNQVISIESFWNLVVAIGPTLEAVQSVDEMDEPALILVNDVPHTLPDADGPLVVSLQDPERLQDFLLAWKPDDARPTMSPGGWNPWAYLAAVYTSVNGLVLVQMGRTNVAYVSDVDSLRAEPPSMKLRAEALVVPDLNEIDAIRRIIHARVVLSLDPPSDGPDEVVRSSGNTIAFPGRDATRDLPEVLILNDRPWSMPEELANLFARKELSAHASARVFAPLSATQMNHRPSNSTHTPRWNAEHMLGRELGFFSQIYAALLQDFPAVDLNPAQMPDDYEPAHPDWSGADEARRIKAVQALVRRYSYLLEGVDLDERAPGSRWTLRRLLRQMDRHWGEHTANVKAKFELDDWPADAE